MNLEFDSTNPMIAAAKEAWLHTSLGGDNPDIYLDHPSSKDASGIYYCPANWQSEDGKTTWSLRSVTIRRPGYSFSLTAKQLSGLFINTKKLCLIFALKDVDAFSGDDNGDDINNLPFDKYMFNDNGETDFVISYINQAGSPFVINPEVVKKMAVKE